MTEKGNLRGVLCLIPTVFTAQDDLDIDNFCRNIESLQDSGMHGLIAMSSMGQYYLLDDQEFETLALAARQSCRNMECLIGTLHQNTREAITRSRFAEKIGADGIYVSPPYYANWTDAESCYAHYKAIHDATDQIRIMAYNFEAFGFTIDINLWERLLDECPRIVAVKECTPLIELGELVRRHRHQLNVMVGLETSLYPNMLLGGAGTVGVFAAAYPRFLMTLYRLCEEGNWAAALPFHRLLAAYLFEWRRGGYSWDNKGISTAAGLVGGFQRAPHVSPTQQEISFHSAWLERLDQLTDEYNARSSDPLQSLNDDRRLHLQNQDVR
jgi:1-pyrroline-4-hydroxy-2-carboxylate deaminase